MIIKNKKASELSLQTIVIFIILLIVLIVIIVFFSSKYGTGSANLMDISNNSIELAKNFK